MQICMERVESLTPEEMVGFVQASGGIEFKGQSREEVYGLIEQTLLERQYFSLPRRERGTIRSLLRKVSGRKEAQLTRLIRRYREDGVIEVQRSVRQCFPTRYTLTDLELLVEVDRAHGRLSGPATRRILQREWQVFGNPAYARLSEISVGHLYNLRNSTGYRHRAVEFNHTQPATIPIGERRRPDPKGAPGYLRIDTVHQGDWNGTKGIYHINAVDTVTQWEVVGCAEGISERFLLPVLEAVLHQFPFRILGLHSDNGSEYVNRDVLRLLNKLLAEFTRSRPNRSSDNALVEGKNGAIIRKHIGYGHIAPSFAGEVHRFYAAYFNPYLNFHRPCGFAQVECDARGRRRRRYPASGYATPYETLRLLPDAHRHLKEGLRWELLDKLAYAASDTQAASRMMNAKTELLRRCKIECPLPPRFL